MGAEFDLENNFFSDDEFGGRDSYSEEELDQLLEVNGLQEYPDFWDK